MTDIFSNKVALARAFPVTGAASGIGLATAEAGAAVDSSILWAGAWRFDQEQGN